MQSSGPIEPLPGGHGESVPASAAFSSSGAKPPPERGGQGQRILRAEDPPHPQATRLKPVQPNGAVTPPPATTATMLTVSLPHSRDDIDMTTA
ncbi:MAG: hypothetical protein VX929_11980 [Pseudomonadota bacterium]|nr:hypothetical protein [Pseudomonadota bacterium]